MSTLPIFNNGETNYLYLVLVKQRSSSVAWNVILNHLLQLTYAFHPQLHLPQTTCFHGVLSYGATFTFIQLCWRPNVHISCFRSLSGCLLSLILVMSNLHLVWQCCHHFISVFVQASSAFFSLGS